MAEEFHGGVCGGGNWWNSSRNLYGSSPCSLSTNDTGRSFGNSWPMNNHDLTIMNTKTTRSSDDSVSDGSSSSHHVVIQDVVKPHDEALQMLGVSLSSSTNPDDWNQDLLHDSGRSEENYSNILQEAAALDSSMNYWQENEWISTTNLSQDSSMINSFKQVNQDFRQPLNSILSTSTACRGLSNGFPLDSVSYSYNSSLLETLFDETDSQPPQQSLLENRIDYSTAENYRVESDEFLPSLRTAPPMANPSFVEQLPTNNLPFTNYNAPLWNDVRSSFLPSSQSQFLPSSLHSKKPNLPSFSAKHQNEDAKDSVSKKSSNEPAFKRPRIETPSPLPTFKVRKEKLGDRITALQQLVSPFGKTDTASVLHEAIEYIRFLQDQVNELSSPYLKQRSTPLQHLQAAEGQERVTQDLKSRGLCLVPVSSTFPVAQTTPADFWTSPTFGGSFK